MKLGDLDELKEVFRWHEKCNLSRKEILDIIDDVKPIELNESVIHDVLQEKKPHGKWRAKTFHDCYCTNCNFSFDIMKCSFLNNMKYCPNCGASMADM